MFDRVVVASENLNNVINQKPAGEGTTGKLTPTPGPSGEVKQSGWAWLIVLGSFFIHVLIDGMAYTFGVYTTDLVQHYGISRQSVGWINSALVGLTFVYGPIASKMSEQLGYRLTTTIGCIIITLGLTAVYFYSAYPFFVIMVSGVCGESLLPNFTHLFE